MNTLVTFCVLLVSTQLVLASKKDANPLLFFSQQTTNNCKTPGLQCKDCQTIQYCSSSSLESLFEIRCEDQSRLRPYCDMETNTCVKEVPSVCDIPETSFHCPGTGYYPDLEDCTNYYICDENKVATKMTCPTGSNWVQGDQACTAGFYCRSYSPKLGQCKGKTNKLVAYTPDKNMYVLCLSNGPILFQCPNKWEIFDEAEVTCKFECTRNGFFPNPSDPRKFYSCTKEGKGYESVLLECPEGLEFVELIPDAGVGICTLSTTTTTTTTEAAVTTEDLIPTEQENDEEIVEDHTENDNNEENQPEEAENNNNEENQPEEAENNNNEENQPEETENNNNEENKPEETENNNNEEAQPDEIEEHIVEDATKDEDYLVEEVVELSENEEIEEHHSEENTNQNDEESKNSGDASVVEENHEEPAAESKEIDITNENNESQSV